MTTVKVGKIFDITIGLHISWFVIYFLLVWSLASQYFPDAYPGFETTTYWIMGTVAGVLLFVSVLAHELSHSLVAKHEGLTVRGITLFFFGGIANADEDGLTAKKEFLIAIAGPLLSVALGGVFWLVNLLPLGAYVNAILDYLFTINILLALFNMIPGFPLDGGRVLRSVLWNYMDYKTSTRYASLGGRAFGVVLAGFGIYQLYAGQGGLWYILLGGFLYLLAHASYEHVRIKETLGSTRVKSVMREATVVDPEQNLESFVETFMEGGVYVGKANDTCYVLDFDTLQSIPRNEWPIRDVRDIFVEVEPAREHHLVFDAFTQMQRQGVNALPVVKNDAVTGVVTTEDVFAQTSSSSSLSLASQS
jgi:Zn-dependent protease